MLHFLLVHSTRLAVCDPFCRYHLKVTSASSASLLRVGHRSESQVESTAWSIRATSAPKAREYRKKHFNYLISTIVIAGTASEVRLAIVLIHGESRRRDTARRLLTFYRFTTRFSSIRHHLRRLDSTNYLRLHRDVSR